MTSSLRSRPAVTATWSEADQRWTLVLPDGRTVTGKRAWVIERRVARELPGTLVLFDPTPAAGVS